MTTAAVTPQPYDNPFDKPLQSEIDEHKVAQAQTVAKSYNGNPFDEPLASEKAEAKAKAAASAGGTGETPADISSGPEGSNTDQQLMSEESQNSATRNGLKIGGEGALAIGTLGAGPLITAGAGGAGALVDAAGNAIEQSGNPVVQRVIAHAKDLLSIQNGFKALGFDMAWEKAHQLYKEFEGKDNK
jgi:hypothetical protein